MILREMMIFCRKQLIFPKDCYFFSIRVFCSARKPKLEIRQYLQQLTFYSTSGAASQRLEARGRCPPAWLCEQCPCDCEAGPAQVKSKQRIVCVSSVGDRSSQHPSSDSDCTPDFASLYQHQLRFISLKIRLETSLKILSRYKKIYVKEF